MSVPQDSVSAMGSGGCYMFFAVPLYMISAGLGASFAWGEVHPAAALLYWFGMLLMTLMHPIGILYYPATMILIRRFYRGEHSLILLCTETFLLNLIAAFILIQVDAGDTAMVIGVVLVGLVAFGIFRRRKKRSEKSGDSDCRTDG